MTNPRRRFLSLVTAVAISATVLTGCNSEPNTPSADQKTLVIGATAQPQVLDMTINNGAAIPQALLYNVYETLVEIDSDGNIVPGLAKSWTISEDRLTYTFELNDQARFPSGTPVDASAVMKSFENIRSGSKINPTLRTEMAVISKITAISDYTLEVKLTRPSNMWLYNIAQHAGIIIDPAKIGDISTSSAGSGPYQIKAWNPGESVILERRDDYWGEKPHFSKVEFRYFSDPSAENAAMLSGDIDIISTVAAPQALQSFTDSSRFTIYEGTTTMEIMLVFNHATAALKNLKVRQAINYAIDRKALVDTIWAGKGMLIGSMVPPSDPWYEDLSNTYSYDPDRARALLAEAGYADGLELRLRVPTLPYATEGARFVASYLEKVGIKVTLDELEFPARWLDVVMGQRNYDMTIIGHAEPRDITRYADPTYYFGYNNPSVQQLVEKADRGTESEQIADMKKVAKILADDAVADFLFLLPSLIVSRTGLSNVPTNANNLTFDVRRISEG